CSEKNFVDVPLRELFDHGKLPGPRLHTACRGLAPSHGHGSTVVYADGVDGVIRAVRENLIRGADHIKLFVTGGVATPGTDPVAAITSRAADLCGLTGQIGVLAPGAWADLIAVEGDPRRDLRTLREVRAVLKGGQVVT